MTIKKIKQETPDCVSIYFDNKYDFVAGQYITIIANINGEEVRRSYSICTATFDDDFGIAVKKIPGGKMSTYLNEVIKVGDEIQVLAPEGSFVFKPKENAHRDHYFFAAGSGITPVMSMIRDVVEKEPLSYCYLYYGSKNEKNIIFNKEISLLEQKYQGQLTVLHTLSQPHVEKGLFGLFKKTTWKGEKGRIDIAKMINFLELFPPRADEQHYYFCGPAEMIQTGEQLLIERDVNSKNIHREYFNVPDDMVKEVEGQSSVLVAHHRGKTVETIVKKGQTILDAMIDAGTDPQHSCTSGACSSCIARIKEGTAEMEVCFALDPDEVEDGYILTCQAKPTSKKIELEYTEFDSGLGWS